jgi:cytochrome P450
VLAWTLYHIAKDEHVQKLVYKELSSVIGVDPNDLPLNADCFDDLVYCRAVLDEALRCGKVMPVAARCSVYETVIDGHQLPPYTPVIHALGVSLDCPNFFPNPEK